MIISQILSFILALTKTKHSCFEIFPSKYIQKEESIG